MPHISDFLIDFIFLDSEQTCVAGTEISTRPLLRRAQPPPVRAFVAVDEPTSKRHCCRILVVHGTSLLLLVSRLDGIKLGFTAVTNSSQTSEA